MKKEKYKFTKLQLDWINDLITGRFSKTTSQLGIKSKSKHAKYCCLGVACLVARRNGLEISKEVDCRGDILFNDCDTDLSENLCDAYKLRDGSGTFKKPIEGHGSLIVLNDEAKWSHKKIGEYILNNPENVFAS